MKEIKLSQGLFAMVDDEDYDELNQYKWYAGKNANVFYAMRMIIVNGNYKTIKMHREILNNHSKNHTDHIDGNGLNNQKENLRIVTARQNCQNKHTISSSKYVGVYFNKNAKKWSSQIKINCKTIYLGLFKNEEDAHNAYLNKLKEIGEIFVTNDSDMRIKNATSSP
jgi:hypothetical protein